VPYLSWYEGELLRRHALTGECRLGRDPETCPVALPTDPSVSRAHALVTCQEETWRVCDLDSHNGTWVAGRALAKGEQIALEDGSELRLGDWVLTFTVGFPGLDGVNFIEGVGDLFAETPPPESSALFMSGLELLYRSSEGLLQEGHAEAMFRRLLTESLALLDAERGFVVLIDAAGGWRSLHRIGDLDDRQGLSHSVVDYVLKRRAAVLSNAPLLDPRFGGASLLELHRGAVLCAPLEVERVIQGVLYLDRPREGRPFSRFDLVLFQAFVRQGALGLRHIQLAQRAMGQADAQGEFLRLKARYERTLNRTSELLAAMNSTLRWVQSYAESGYGERAAILKHQAERLQFLVGSGLQETLREVPVEAPVSTSLSSVQETIEPAWRDLLGVRKAALELEPLPSGAVWAAGNLASQALMGLVEPMLMQMPEGGAVRGQWIRGPSTRSRRPGSSGAGTTSAWPWCSPRRWTTPRMPPTGPCWAW